MCRSRFTCTQQPDRYDVQPESQACVAIVTRQPDRYDVQPESQARVAIVTRQPDRYDVQPESQALLVCRRMHGSSRFAASPPYQRAPPIGQHPPPPPDSHTQGWTGHRAYRAMPEGPMHIFGPVLWLPGPNLVPSPALVTTLTPAKHTHIGGLHLLRLEHIRLHRSLLSGSHFSPKLKCCHSNTTPSSRLPPAGRNGRCKYRLWAAHAVAH